MNKIAFDVDGCLIWAEGMKGEPDTPRYEVIKLLHWFQKNGDTIYIWSGGGVDYARHWRDKLGLMGLIKAKGEFVPDIAVDDEVVELGIVNIKV